jgi:hypothetical protein
MTLSITHLLIHTLTIEEQNGVSNSGSPTFADQTTMASRIERTNTMVINFAGNEQKASHRVVTLSEVGQNARVYFPGDDTDDTTEARRPIAVTQGDTTAGDTLYETYF